MRKAVILFFALSLFAASQAWADAPPPDDDDGCDCSVGGPGLTHGAAPWLMAGTFSVACLLWRKRPSR